MIVEDEEQIRNGLRKHVPWNEMGFEVVGEAPNGANALRQITLLKPEVVLTDVRMPEMDGLEFMACIRSHDADIKIVVLSGYDEFTYAQKAIEYGASAYLLKPIKDEEIEIVFRKIAFELDEVQEDRIPLSPERLLMLTALRHAAFGQATNRVSLGPAGNLGPFTVVSVQPSEIADGTIMPRLSRHMIFALQGAFGVINVVAIDEAYRCAACFEWAGTIPPTRH